jgi:hypothetical protein
LTKFADSLGSDDKEDADAVDRKFREACATAKKKENRFVSCLPACPYSFRKYSQVHKQRSIYLRDASHV